MQLTGSLFSWSTLFISNTKEYMERTNMTFLAISNYLIAPAAEDPQLPT